MKKPFKKLTFKKLIWPIIFFLAYLFFLCLIIKATWRIGKGLAIKNQEKQFLKDLETSLELLGKWFVKNQTENGDFVYEINVLTGEKNEDNNIVRQAGAFYSMAQFYRKNKEEEVKKVLEKGFEFFKNLAEKQNDSLNSEAIVYQGGKQSNTAAVLLLALIEYMEAEEKNKEKYLEFARNLGNYLVSTQKPNGGFINEYPNVESDYNNGETFYALTRMYLLDNNEVYLKSTQKAADYLIGKYGKIRVNLSFYAWGMAGFVYLYKIEPKEEYWQFMRTYTDGFFRERGNLVEAFLRGENNDYPRGNLGVFLEGIAHVAWLAKDKDIQYFAKLKSFIENSLSYLLTLQINGPRSLRTSEFEQIKGGICYDYDCQTQRIDIVHHNLSAIYLYLTLVK